MHGSILLQPPGAGIPLRDRLAARAMLRVTHAMMSRATAERLFINETQKLCALATSVSPESASHPILIPPTFGLEDSSRYWSIFMTLEHLRIVNGAIIRMLERLAQEKRVPGEVRIADAKPRPGCGPEVLNDFQQTNADYLKRVRLLPNLKTRMTHPHPWFGPFNAHRWNCLAAMHMSLHRRQVRRILNALRGY